MRQWWSGPGRAAALVAVGVLVLVVAGRLGVGSPSRTPWRPVPPATATGPFTAESVPPTTVAAAVVGEPVDRSVGARQLALAAGSLWVAAQDSNQVVRVDPASGRVSAVIPVPRPLGIAAGFGALWVTSDGEHPALLRVDPASLRVTARTLLEMAAEVAAGAGSVWVACGEGDGPSVLRVDPVSGRITARVQLSTVISSGCGLWSVAAEGHWAWVSDEAGSLWRIDAAGRRASRVAASLSSATTGRQPASLAASDGTVWAASSQELLRLDPTSGRVVVRLGDAGGDGRAGGSSAAVAVTPSTVWWAGPAGLRRVDPSKNQVTGTIPGLAYVPSLVADASMLWAITDQGVVRVDPARAS